MDRKSLVATVVIVVLVLSLIITPSLVVRTSSKVCLNLRDEARNHITVTLEVYKNGELVRRKVGDPISDQWLNLIANYLLGMEAYQGISWKTEDGNVRSGWGSEYNEGNPVPKLAIGTGSTAYTTDYALANKVMETTLDSNYITVTDTGSEFNVTFTYTFIVDSACDISEAGLFIKNKYSNSDYGWVLIAHDTFTPVSLQANDGITIKYSFIIDYSSPPFLKTFWELLLDYFMGLRGAGCSVGFTRLDFGYDYYCPYSDFDEVKEKLCIAYALEDVAWSPTLNPAPSVSDKWGLRKIVALTCSDQKISLDAIAIQSNSQSTYTVYGLVFYLYSDSKTSDSKSSTYVPIAYIKFDSPVSVDCTKFFDVNLTITFNQG